MMRAYPDSCNRGTLLNHSSCCLFNDTPEATGLKGTQPRDFRAIPARFAWGIPLGKPARHKKASNSGLTRPSHSPVEIPQQNDEAQTCDQKQESPKPFQPSVWVRDMVRVFHGSLLCLAIFASRQPDAALREKTAPTRRRFSTPVALLANGALLS